MAMVLLVTLLVILISLLTRVAYNAISCYFITPRRIKKIMEKQGVCGPKPRLLIGNILDMASFVSKSTSHDMHSINHDIVGRLLPHYVAWSKQYGSHTYLLTFFLLIIFAVLVGYLTQVSRTAIYFTYLYIKCLLYMFREKVYSMEWDRAKDVPN